MFSDDSVVSVCPRLSLHVTFRLARLKLVGGVGAGAGPLVASGVRELVAVGRDEVVKDGGTTGACEGCVSI